MLFVTLLLASGLAIALGSYTMLTIQSAKLSHRSFLATGALNLAEAGLEFGLDALNREDWSSWETSGSNRTLTKASIALGNGAVGDIQAVVYDVGGGEASRIVAQGRISPATGRPIIKQVEITLEHRTLFGNQVVSQTELTVAGGTAIFDGYDSRTDTYSTNGMYDKTKRKDSAGLASASVETDALDISNSEVWGYIATAGGAPSIGATGSVMGEDTPEGVTRDETRITTDFSANFPPVKAPTSVTSEPLKLIEGSEQLGESGKESLIVEGNITNKNGEVLTISGDVTLYVKGDIILKGQLLIEEGASLKLYVVGDLDASGGSIVNTSGAARDLLIFGMATTPNGQEITLSGSTAIHAGIYAPNADITLNGGGDDAEFSGSVVGYEITVNGGYEVHVDEGMTDELTGATYTMEYWRELIGDARIEL